MASPAIALDRPQSTLPDEIYLIIFNNIKLLHPVRWRQILANLTLVCWHFCHIIQPQVFRALMFTDRSGLEGKPSYLNGLSFPEAIVHGLHSATRLVEHVTEISLKKFAWDTIESLAICGKAMSLMPNLHTISLTTVTINAQLLSDICELTGLRRLSLQLCTFHKDITSDFIWALPNLKLRHCHITDLHMGSRISIKVLSHIIDPSCLESFHSSSWEISAPVLGKLQGDESRLCHLSLHKTTYDTRLLGILQQCPQLKTLRINRIISKSPGRCLSSLPKTSIPDLEAIMCPPTIISDLVPGRPLNKIDLSGVHYASVLPGASSLDIVTSLLPLGTSGINTLFQSSAQVRSLCVPVEIFLAESFGKHFPLLEELAIEFYHPNYTKIGRFVSMDAIEKGVLDVCAMPSIPSLKTLRFTFGFDPLHWPFYLDLPKQLALITTNIGSNFPEMCTVSFTNLIQWHKDKTGWTGSVPIEEYPNLRMMHDIGLLHGAHDYKGCLHQGLEQG